MPPRRSELGDHDQALWERDTKGEPKDPWSFDGYLPLTDNDGEKYVYRTSSRGGLDELRRVAKALGQRIEKNGEGELPVVSLDVDDYPHKDYGRVLIPALLIVRWEKVEEKKDEEPNTDDGAPPKRGDMDDEIPF